MEYVCASYVLCVTSILDFFFGCEPGAARIAAIFVPYQIQVYIKLQRHYFARYDTFSTVEGCVYSLKGVLSVITAVYSSVATTSVGER